MVVVGPDGQPIGTVGGRDEDPSRLIEQPAKVMRIGTMIKQLLEEVRAAPLDEDGRQRLVEIHRRSIVELEDGLAPELRDELERISVDFTEGTTPTESELRIAQAQLVGWLEGLFHGIQAALVAQQMAARHAAGADARQARPAARAYGGPAIRRTGSTSTRTAAPRLPASSRASEAGWPVGGLSSVVEVDGDAVAVVGEGHLVGEGQECSGWAFSTATRRAGPLEHRDVVGHVAEDQHVGGVDAQLGGDDRQTGALVDAGRGDLHPAQAGVGERGHLGRDQDLRAVRSSVSECRVVGLTNALITS